MQEGLGGSVAAEVRGDVDSLDRTRRREVLRQRVHDGRLMRRSGQWLRAGVLDDGERQHPETGVRQGGVLAPGRAHSCRPQVLDAWCAREVRPRLQGRAFLMRCADDCCIGGEREGEARKILTVRPKRFARLSWTSHAEKTARIAFGQPDARQASAQGNGTFALLGLTHDGAKARRGL